MGDVIQGTAEWHELRRGRVTASRIADVMAKTKSGYGAARENYMAELAVEILTGTTPEGFTNAAMQWGTDHEPQARAMYEITTGNDVEEVGFVIHPTQRQAGASPDGLVGANGLVEIKCPNTATHIKTLRGAGIDRKYLLQMQWQMICTGRAWCDFVSFDPRMPDEMQLHVARVDRDDVLCQEIEAEVEAFLRDLSDMISDVRAKAGIKPPFELAPEAMVG